MILREYEPKDAQQMYELHIRTVQKVVSKDYEPEIIDQWTKGRSPQKIQESIAKVDKRLVVEEDSLILGFGEYKNDEVVGLYVSADAQGRGVGTMILTALLNYIKEDGFLCAKADSTITAQSFYEKHGFIACKEGVHPGRNGGPGIACVIMQKLL